VTVQEVTDRLLEVTSRTLAELAAEITQEDGEIAALIFGHALVETYTPRHGERARALLLDTLKNLEAAGVVRVTEAG
jgi:hypothetical protein